jgi:hypothetical protein
MPAVTPSVHTCRWAEPTLFLQPPLWYEAWDYPWSCTAGGIARILTDVTACRACPRWQPQASERPASRCARIPVLAIRSDEGREERPFNSASW